MFVGHFAAALAAKRIAPAVSLGTLVLAAMLADLLWCGFLLAGVEHVEFRPAHGAANYLAAADITWSHSLLMDAAWSAGAGAVFYIVRRSRRGALVIAGAVLSHWFLDWISHRPDMPLAPGIPRHVGLGLWTSLPLTLLVEGGFWLVAMLAHARATKPRTRLGAAAWWIGVAILTLAWYNNLTGPPPRDPHTASIASLLFFSLSVAWAGWMNRTYCARNASVLRVRWRASD